jgi:aspartyl-tRNA(Asn)/glutamyl-tRNA(Gln) amidotransferase subunit C
MIDINHIAKLARLGLNKKEKKKFEKDLGDILNFINKLKEVKTDNIEPTAQVTGLENVTREDKFRKKGKQEREKLLDLFPDREKEYLKVKNVL